MLKLDYRLPIVTGHLWLLEGKPDVQSKFKIFGVPKTKVKPAEQTADATQHPLSSTTGNAGVDEPMGGQNDGDIPLAAIGSFADAEICELVHDGK